MASYDPYTNDTSDTFPYASMGKFDGSVDGFIFTSGAPAIISMYKMIGIASSIWVSWIATVAPDFSGTQYTGPGTLDLATISVSDVIVE